MLRQWPCSPAVLTANTELLLVDAQLCVLRLWHLVAVALLFLLSVIKVVDAVVEGTCAEEVAGCDAEALACLVGLLPPAYIALGTSLLRADVWEELLLGSLCIDAYVL